MPSQRLTTYGGDLTGRVHSSQRLSKGFNVRSGLLFVGHYLFLPHAKLNLYLNIMILCDSKVLEHASARFANSYHAKKINTCIQEAVTSLKI